MRLRIVNLWPLAAFGVLLSLCLLIWELWKSKLTLETLLMLVLGLGSTGFLLWPCLTRGAFVSTAFDPFFYSAYGQYVADHHRGFAVGLSPIDQYGAVLSWQRFGTASVLSLFSVLFHFTTAEALPAFAFIVLVNIFSGFVVLGRRFGCNRLFSLAAGLFAVIGGWTSNALHIGALDNLLFLSLFPFLVVRVELYRFGSKSWSTSLGLATLAAAVFYVYPEGLSIAGVIFLPLFCQSVWFGIYRRGRAWRRYVISGCLVLVLIIPCVRLFFGNIFQHSKGTGMVGVIFPGLLSPRFLPAMFGFGQEYSGTICSPHDLVLPITMLVFIVLGCATWMWHRQKRLIMVFMIFIMMTIWQGLLAKDDYGLYKILFIGSLIWIPALFLGGTAVANFVPRPTRPIVVTLGTIIFFSGALAQRIEQQEKIPFRQLIPMKWYSDLAGLRHKVGNRPVLLVCDYVFDKENAWFDQDWALFFLRRVSLKVPQFFGLDRAYDPDMQLAKSVSEPVAFVLVNGPIEGAVWKNERFSLFELADQAKLIGVGTKVSFALPSEPDWFQPANGLENVNGKPFVWLGNNTTRFLIVSRIAQTANFSAEECLTGPSRPENKDRQIRISIGDKVWQTDVSGALSIKVPLKPGLNYLDIACQGSPAVSAQSENDPRALPLGLWDYRISNKEETKN
jgi:hypothetical protein